MRRRRPGRRGAEPPSDAALCRGPGNLTRALGVTLRQNRARPVRGAPVHRGSRPVGRRGALGTADRDHGRYRAAVARVRGRMPRRLPRRRVGPRRAAVVRSPAAMESIQATRLRKGMLIKRNATLYRVLEFSHVTPGKGRAFVQTRMRNVRAGTLTDHKFASNDSVERAMLDARKMQYLYADGDGYHFMDTESYEQVHLTGETLGDTVSYLLPDATITVEFFEDSPVGIELPLTVGPRGRGDRARDKGGHGQRAAQAGAARDRPRRAGAAVRQQREQGPREHGHRRISLARLTGGRHRRFPSGRRRAVRARRRVFRRQPAHSRTIRPLPPPARVGARDLARREAAAVRLAAGHRRRRRRARLRQAGRSAAAAAAGVRRGDDARLLRLRGPVAGAHRARAVHRRDLVRRRLRAVLQDRRAELARGRHHHAGDHLPAAEPGQAAHGAAGPLRRGARLLRDKIAANDIHFTGKTLDLGTDQRDLV